MPRKRPLIAVALAVYPGLGHVYLRRWLRSLVWFVLVVSAVALVVPPEAVDGSASTLTTVRSLSEQLSLAEQFALVSVLAFNMLDAYLIAEYAGGRTDAPTCPACGKALDEDLDFCHWCTTRFEEPVEETAA